MIDIKTEELVKLKEKGMSDREIAQHFTAQGRTISKVRVTQRLLKYYRSQGKEKPKAVRRKEITDEELYELKEQGMTDREIVQHFTAQGRTISKAMVSQRLLKYYRSQGKEKLDVRKVEITDEELYELKEQGISDREIANYFTERGRKISEWSVNQKLLKYYRMQGKEKPAVRRKEITDEELYELKEQGMADREIAQHFTEQGRKISESMVSQRLLKYYRMQGKEKPDVRRKQVTDEELYKLKEQGMADREIAQHFIEKGIEIKTSTVTQRLLKYYRMQGKEKTKVVRRVEVTNEELYKLKEQGMTDIEIVNYFIEQGRKISGEMVSQRLLKYYRMQGKEKPAVRRKQVTDEELYKLKEQGMADREIAQHFTAQGRTISKAMVSQRLLKYYRSQGKEKPNVRKVEKPKAVRKVEIPYEDAKKEIFMLGMTIQEFVSKFGEESQSKSLEEQFKRLRVIAEYSKKENDRWIPDNNFITIINFIQNPNDDLRRYEESINMYVSDGKCKKGSIDLIKDKIFGSENTDLMVYVLSRANLKWDNGYDFRVFKLLKAKYQQRVDKYLERLYNIENNRRKNKTNSENGSNSEISDAER